MADFIQMIERRIAKALRGIRLAFRAEITRINTTGGVQTTQLAGLEAENLEEVEMFQHYGLTSVPPEGAMAIVLPLGGDTTHGIIITTEHSAYRLQGLASGEVALYSDEGTSVVLRRGKILEANCETFNMNCKNFNVNATEKATFTTPNLYATGQLTSDGQITGNGGMAIKGGEGGKAASIEGNVEHTGGTFSSPDIEVGGVKQGTHKHNTPSGLSDGPVNG
ncbi:phage baseplate assembly protein V [Serratia marcescens]|uniref:Phage baseplate assembly protein V n=1 Tax=Serratia marcescens TaxID=615 RepID=A0A5C7BVY0_SERMA|nr:MULTISPECIES: phage baseplate assembly protein V [Serratia]TXE27154.1 phage baseplate assembly protein V [Serratia marcescens]TXE55289.1 phage baseplate assembly protein V [Serratia marcescens]